MAHDQSAYGAIVEGAFEGDNPYHDAGQAARDSGTFAVFTPEEAVDFAAARQAEGLAFPLVPLLAGLDPEVGHESVRLIAEGVVPALRARGVRVD